MSSTSPPATRFRPKAARASRAPTCLNKIDLAPHVGASLTVMERDAKRMRGTRPFVFSNLRAGEGVDTIARFVEDKGGLQRGNKRQLLPRLLLYFPPALPCWS